MDRRSFLASAAALAAPPAPAVMTVRGLAAVSTLGLMLPHEHLFSMFGEEPAEHAQYDSDALLAAVVPYLKSVQKLGCATIVDATAAYFGRAPRILRTVSEMTGLHLVTNTGYYGAANDRYVPKFAFDESADQLAARWIREAREGIGASGIRPGFIKLGVDAGPLSAIDRKLIVAGARAHRATGLVIAVHTGDNAAAVEQQLAILKAEGVSTASWIWVHANQCKDDAAVLAAASQGAWISLDGLDPTTLERHLALCLSLRQQGKLSQVLLSHDGNSFRAGGKRPMRPYTELFTGLLPRLRSASFSQDEIRMLTVENPGRAFAVRGLTFVNQGVP
ncbi:MAG: phosphotriesterase [Candidatus Solibacter usitatus]|nr:phosphotriesterase [Candidatus Solibacter usitatus]